MDQGGRGKKKYLHFDENDLVIQRYCQRRYCFEAVRCNGQNHHRAEVYPTGGFSVERNTQSQKLDVDRRLLDDVAGG